MNQAGHWGALLLPFLMACGGTTEENTGAVASANEPGAGQSAVVDDLSVPNVVGIAVKSPDHKTLVAAVLHVKYQDVLSNAGPFTVYAPTDAAFAALPAGTLDDLMKPENKSALENILEYHVALGVFNTENMTNGRSVGMANGDAQAQQPHDTFEPTLVLANLDRQTLLNAAESLCAYAAGGARLLLSGLLVEQRAEIESAYASRGVYVKAVRERDGWLALEATGMESCDGGLCS